MATAMTASQRDAKNARDTAAPVEKGTTAGTVSLKTATVAPTRLPPSPPALSKTLRVFHSAPSADDDHLSFHPIESSTTTRWHSRHRRVRGTSA